MFLGILLLFRIIFFNSSEDLYEVGQEVTVKGILWDEPKRSMYGQRLKVEGLILSVPEYPEYNFGDTISATGVLELNEFEANNGEVITEKMLRNPEINLQTPSWIMNVILSVLERIVSVTKKTLPTNESALLLGITLGIRSEFSKPLLDTFTSTGIVHVVAASGSNVATLTGMLLFSLNILFKRQISTVITVIIVAWYSVLSGFDPPIVRASIMALVTLTAQLYGRQNFTIFTLFLTCWIMLMIDPYLAGDIGFQLSVTATAGIVLLKPLLDKLYKAPKIIKDDLSTTLSAQVASLPILLGTFGSFAPLSLVVNILILWSVPIIMMLGLFASFSALIHEAFALPFLYSAYPFLAYFLYIVKFCSHYISPIQIRHFNEFFTISYYLITISLWEKLNGMD